MQNSTERRAIKDVENLMDFIAVCSCFNKKYKQKVKELFDYYLAGTKDEEEKEWLQKFFVTFLEYIDWNTENFGLYMIDEEED